MFDHCSIIRRGLWGPWMWSFMRFSFDIFSYWKIQGLFPIQIWSLVKQQVKSFEKKQSVKWIITVSRQRYGKEVWNKQCTQNFHRFSKGFPSGALFHSHLSSLFMLSAHFVQASAKNGKHRTHLTKVTYPGATVFSWFRKTCTSWYERIWIILLFCRNLYSN